MCKLENKYKEKKTGKLFKIVNFETHLDSIIETLWIKQLDNDEIIQIDECMFRSKFEKMKNE